MNLVTESEPLRPILLIHVCCVLFYHFPKTKPKSRLNKTKHWLRSLKNYEKNMDWTRSCIELGEGWDKNVFFVFLQTTHECSAVLSFGSVLIKKTLYLLSHYSRMVPTHLVESAIKTYKRNMPWLASATLIDIREIEREYAHPTQRAWTLSLIERCHLLFL